jgi:twitching motility protein PilT
MECEATHDVVPAMQILKPVLEYALAENASDVHVAAGVAPTARIDGEVRVVPDMQALTRDTAAALVRSMMTSDQAKCFEEDLELDFTFSRPGFGRFRVNAFHEQGRIAASLRRIPENPPALKELGLPKVVGDLCELRQGLVLVTGPTGSGKSTTLAGIIDRINRTRCERIVTIEDPIEFVHPHIKSFVQQRELGRDTLSFGRALKSALREDPDVLLIGEMRDHEAIATAVSAAETGHLVFATLHTNSAAQTVSRIVDSFASEQQTQIRQQLSGSLAAVITQRLVPLARGGRVVVAEILIANQAVRNLIREGKDHQVEIAMQSGAKDGMTLFDASLIELVRSGRVTMETALTYAHDPRSFKTRLSGK